MDIHTKEDFVEKQFAILGRAYYEANKDNASEKDAAQFAVIAEAMEEINIPMPKGFGVFSVEEAINAANEIGYPVLVRPSFVLGGRMMHIVYDEQTLREKVKEAIEFNSKHPVLVDKYIVGQESEVDAI